MSIQENITKKAYLALLQEHGMSDLVKGLEPSEKGKHPSVRNNALICLYNSYHKKKLIGGSIAYIFDLWPWFLIPAIFLCAIGANQDCRIYAWLTGACLVLNGAGKIIEEIYDYRLDLLKICGDKWFIDWIAEEL